MAEALTDKPTRNKKYKPILPGTADWPVVRLSKNRKQFIEYVAQTTIERIIAANKGKEELREELESTLYLEKLRIKQNPWKVDPPDESKFWSGVKNDLVDLVGGQNTVEKERKILGRIVHRYANEIAGNFKQSHYKMAREMVKFGFARLLNATRVKRFGAFFRNEYTLRDKIQIIGKTKQLRKLAKIGTVVMVPTHFSNLDSILIGWIIHSLGLPAFIYGAGLNLFNIKIFAYFMNSLGAYKVDRRKKNPIYLETLKTYSMLAIQEGAHSLFFPGGTRSRSGKIETHLKLGLLGTAMEAQRGLYMENTAGSPRKIFIVPVTLNYNFVLEAPSLIKQYLAMKGQERFYIETDEFSTSYKMTKFLFKFFAKGSDISVSIGPGLDLMGNYVDNKGRSIDRQGRFIDTRDYFLTDGKITANQQREAEYTRQLAEVIVKEYHRINRVFASHLVAFTAFTIWRKRYNKLDLYDFLRIPEEELFITYKEFRDEFDHMRKEVLKLKKQGKLNIAPHMRGDLDEVIKFGIENVGMYHAKRPLIFNKQGDIITSDLTTLYYYHNRMDGYDLESKV
ncbi:1-acyl-sn-glycerol-3-phosphate acyltransferase [Fulvivirga sedimenti]|uniref:Glycerol-3-phosphate acyltransferase n=1 Tax=Fulvivirga sedimenti TaxID=2879465 RepID=A0A9X1HMP6_9BACT|nr:1-acyl-sn-glycerol-3-phosphate acyltransferase [Fulvivirga sedimenti]MCA6073825.1 1-acyl-sn-glycerol-3-phosphate acyltransferase [Fulvivirga sedimenti]